MGRGKRFGLPALALFAVANVGVTWSRFNSTLYPYSIQQPSSFRHIILRETSGVMADYFFPSLGSFTTNLNVKAVPGRSADNEARIIRSLGGQHVRRTGWAHLAGQREPVMGADFKTLAGRWTIERVTFVSRGYVWYITMSYEEKYRKIRPTLLRMMQSFRLR
jgi:hypothetical protein